MNTAFSLFESIRDWTAFAFWQSFLFLGIAVAMERFFRRSPWQAHLILTLGIVASVLAPTLSLLIDRVGGGLVSSGSIFALEKQAEGVVDWFGMAILVGAPLFLLFFLYSVVSARHLMFRARPFPDRESQEALLEGSRMMQNVSLPVLFTSPSVKSPTVWSWGLHPAVLLPESLSETLSPEERDGIFLHELAHMTRRDHWAALFARLCGVFLFWNPLYWAALKLSDLAADRACDLLVLSREKVSPEIYGETLLRLAAVEQNRPVFQYLSRKELLMKRIDTILDFEENRKVFSVARKPLSILGTTVVVLFLITTLAFCQEKKTDDYPFTAPENRLTYLVTFEPAEGFEAKVFDDLFAVYDPARRESGVKWMFTKMERDKDGKQIFLCLTDDPEKVRAVIDSLSPLKYVQSKRLTKETYEKHVEPWKNRLDQTVSRGTTVADEDDARWKSPDAVGHTHLVVFQPANDFMPRTAQELLDKLNGELSKRDGIPTGYFRTYTDKSGRLIGRICTNNLEALDDVIASIPELDLVKTWKLDQKTFDEHLRGTQDPATTDGGFASPQGGYTHLVVFGPEGDFHPTGPMDYLNLVNPKLEEFGVRCGYFRSRREGDKLIASNATSTPEAYKRLVESIPQFRYIETRRLTKEMFDRYETSPQESLPIKRLLDVEQSVWFGRLNERQQQYVRWDENQFAYLYNLDNFDVGNDREGFERRWLAELEKPEPGHPGYSMVAPYDRAIFGLATIKSEKALGPLVKIATERILKDNAHRHNATKALGMLGDPAAIAELIPLLDHFNFNTRWEAQIALVRLTGENFADDIEAWGRWYNEHRNRLGKELPEFDGKRVDWSCGSEDPQIREYCDPKKQKEMDDNFFQKGRFSKTDSQAPKVVKFEPALEAKDVDPKAIAEIRVTFDRDMSVNGYSWCGGPPLFPETTDKPRWIDNRTCVLPVKLEEKRLYRLGINGRSALNFKSAEGVPATITPYFFSTKGYVAVEPKIVKLEPENGAKNVDPEKTTELRVTFDIDMSMSGFSWCGGGETFPETTDKPRWIDNRTCVLPVKLVSGKTYQLSINARRFKNFRSADGVPVEPVPYSFSTGEPVVE